MAKVIVVFSSSLIWLVVALQCCGAKDFTSAARQLKRQQLFERRTSASFSAESSESDTFAAQSPVFIGPQDGLKQADRIDRLPGQPDGINFNQYSGYVTVDPNAGRALFYYFVESSQDPSSKPLVLWINQSPYCSSVGHGAFTELGPFRVRKDGRTLYHNQYAWNRVANIIFIESPAGAGFSYSNTSSDYKNGTDHRTARDTYTFLINWLERFPEYKTRDFFIAGERYAGHFAPQLAQLILHYNNKRKHTTTINLKKIIIGNPIIDDDSIYKGILDYYWTHALISDEIYAGVKSNCIHFSPDPKPHACGKYQEELSKVTEDNYLFDIYAPLCNSTSASSYISDFDPCSPDYVFNYLNNPQVQVALHVHFAATPYQWELCNYTLRQNWSVDTDLTVLPIIAELMEKGLQVWLYSGDTDIYITVTSTRYAINKLMLPVKTPWYPWYIHNEVGGYVVEYQNLTFVTVKGAGQFVPSYQPARGFALFSSFINGKLPPSTKNTKKAMVLQQH